MIFYAHKINRRGRDVQIGFRYSLYHVLLALALVGVALISFSPE